MGRRSATPPRAPRGTKARAPRAAVTGGGRGQARPPAAAGEIDVFSYLDYRAFLRDHYLRGKERGRLSFRGFSRRAGLGSPNYLKLVIDGARNLTDPMAARFAAAAGLANDQASYFCELVRFNQWDPLESTCRHASLSIL